MPHPASDISEDGEPQSYLVRRKASFGTRWISWSHRRKARLHD